MLSMTARTTLLQLANNATLIDQTQQRISTGRKWTSVIDGGTNYLQARDYMKSVDELTGYKQEIDDGLSMIKGSMEGIKSSKGMLEQLRSVVEDAQDGSLSEIDAAARAGTILTQYDNLLADSTLNDTNLVNGSLGGQSLGFKHLPYDSGLWANYTTNISTDTGYSNLDTHKFFEYNGELFVDGQDMNSYDSKFIKYDGTNWSDITTTGGTSELQVSDFTNYQDEMYLSANTQPGSKILKYDGSSWTDLTSGLLSDTGFSEVAVHEFVQVGDDLMMEAQEYDTFKTKGADT
ncbi:MAG: flagellin [Alphaproteobacteria bacterium]